MSGSATKTILRGCTSSARLVHELPSQLRHAAIHCAVRHKFCAETGEITITVGLNANC